jgi:hypothetical protein
MAATASTTAIPVIDISALYQHVDIESRTACITQLTQVCVSVLTCQPATTFSDRVAYGKHRPAVTLASCASRASTLMHRCNGKSFNKLVPSLLCRSIRSWHWLRPNTTQATRISFKSIAFRNTVLICACMSVCALRAFTSHDVGNRCVKQHVSRILSSNSQWQGGSRCG